MSIPQVLILSQERVANFQANPKDKPIYLIRIFDNPQLLSFLPYAKLQSPEQFQIIKSYTFDDVSRFVDNEHVLFNEEMAKTIIMDFYQDGKDCQTLLIHCRAGKSRSPAVAMALSEIFHFKTPEQLDDMKKRFSIYNEKVYNTMLKSRQTMNTFNL